MRQSLKKVEMSSKFQGRRYLLPNLVTVGNLFAGFLSIVYASSDRLWQAAVAIGIAIILDGLDGRVARRFNATSRFGVEFDSFSDLISFGIAPAYLMYQWCFRQPADEFGVFVCFVYLVAAASRLARFNLSQESKSSFQGLPTPGAAGFVAALVNIEPLVLSSPSLVTVCAVMMLSLAFLMVSQVPFFSLKRVRIEEGGFGWLVLLGGLIALIWYHNEAGFFLLALTYVLSGPFFWLSDRRAAKSGQKKVTQKVS